MGRGGGGPRKQGSHMLRGQKLLSVIGLVLVIDGGHRRKVGEEKKLGFIVSAHIQGKRRREGAQHNRKGGKKREA